MTLKDALLKLQDEGSILSDGHSEWEPEFVIESIISQDNGNARLKVEVVICAEPDGHQIIREGDENGRILYREVWPDESPEWENK